ncbi:hypothetical protein [Methylobacterium radiotolerans]|uniref:hypothetical protein n=1 Tax=Methylobacterium radiotolerans TaxID=31998 RepID=UPI001F21A7B8|nr:hypothetical protein [Methylobacterium radiotolerans]UIY45572.1 hypothetical protein LZ599_31220 [Methylobacterium radiotolerans]
MQPMPEPSVARIKSAVEFMTYVVDRYGERYRPVLDSLIVDLEAHQRSLSPAEGGMPKRLRSLPDRSETTADTPLHLDTAARLAFPDGVVTGLTLRNAAARGDLEYERLGGRIITTLRWIREWRERNRRPAKSAAERREPAHLTDEYRVAADPRAIPKEGTLSEAHQAASAALQVRLRALSKPKKAGRTRRPKE